jgi:hypothetical protein
MQYMEYTISSGSVYSDDDSFVNVNHQSGEVPFGDLTTNEILAIGNQPRVRKQTVVPQLEQTVNANSDTRVAKKNAVAADEQWWVGQNMPEMPEKGETNPLLATHFFTADYNTTIQTFANGILKDPDTNKPAAYQEDHDTCQEYINHILGRANTEQELDDKCNEMERNATKLAIREWHKRTEIDLQKEINLTMLTNEICLRFTRTYTSRQQPESDLFDVRGKYDALVTVRDPESRFHGQTILYTPTNDWVEDNFTQESLAVVQAVADETSVVYQMRDSSKTEKGYIPLDKTLQYTVNSKHYQISKMRYIPKRKGKDAMGKIIQKPEAWHGLIQVNSGEPAEHVTLDRDWVMENTDPPMRKFLQNIRLKDGHFGFVLIPEGDNEPHFPGIVTFMDNAPIVKYYYPKDSTKRRRCVLDSAASGLNYLGYHRLRVLIASTMSTDTMSRNPMGYLQDIFENKLQPEERKIMQFVSLSEKRKRKWNALNSPNDFLMCVLGIRSSDGKTDHAICIADGWIFDSNFEKALPLSKESLDLCSSSNERKTDFVEVTRGILLKSRKK